MYHKGVSVADHTIVAFLFFEHKGKILTSHVRMRIGHHVLFTKNFFSHLCRPVCFFLCIYKDCARYAFADFRLVAERLSLSFGDAANFIENYFWSSGSILRMLSLKTAFCGTALPAIPDWKEATFTTEECHGESTYDKICTE